MHAATIYQRNNIFFIHASSKTEAGFWILSEPAIKIEAESSPEVLEQAIASALKASKENIDQPKSFDGIFEPILRLAGVRSWSIFAKNAKCVEVEEGREIITLIPTKNLGIKAGFEPLQHLKMTHPVGKPGLADLILKALNE